MSFLYKKDLTQPLDEYLQITDDIYFYQDRKYSTIFKELIPKNRPSIISLMTFLNQPVIYFGAYSYNSLRFSCQVPATITYLIDEEFIDLISSFKIKFNFTIIKFVPKELIQILSNPLKSMVIDCYLNDLFTFSDQSYGKENLDEVVSDKLNTLDRICAEYNQDFTQIESEIIENLEYLTLMYSYLKDVSWEERNPIIQINYRLKED